MSFGIISSKKGKKASGSTNIKDLTISSDYLTFSVYKQGDTTITVDDAGGNASGKYYRKTVSHDLGYPSQLMAFNKIPSSFDMSQEEGEWFTVPFSSGNITGGPKVAYHPYVMHDNISSSNIRFSFVSYFDSLSSTEMDISYLLLTDNLISNEFIKGKQSGVGMKVSESGDVKSATVKNLSFSAGFPVLQMEELSDVIDIPASVYGSWTKSSYPHNLGYVPAFQGYYRINTAEGWSNWYSQPTYDHGQVEPWEEIGFKVSADKNNINVYYTNSVDGTGGTEKAFDMEVKYNIFTNKIADE